MGKVKVDIRALKKFEKQLIHMRDETIEQFIKESTLILAGEFLRQVKERTPVGDYGSKVEFTTRAGEFVSFTASTQPTVGGTLRNGWKVSDLKETTHGYEVEIYNDAENINKEYYAVFVENGHVIRNKKDRPAKGWVKGRFMLRNTEIDMAFTAPEILEKLLERFLRKMLNE